MCVKLVNLGMSLITPVDCCQALSLSVLKYGLAHTHLPKKCSKGEIYFIAALEKQSKRHEKSNEIRRACYRCSNKYFMIFCVVRYWVINLTCFM